MVARWGAKRTSTQRSHGRTSDWNGLSSSLHRDRGTVTHPFDLVQIRRRLSPERLDAHQIPTLQAFPNIRETTRGVRDGVT